IKKRYFNSNFFFAHRTSISPPRSLTFSLLCPHPLAVPLRPRRSRRHRPLLPSLDSSVSPSHPSLTCSRPRRVVFTQSCTPKLPFQSGQKCKSSIAFKPESNLIPMLKDNCPIARRLPLFHASSTGRNHIQLKLDDEYSHDSTFMRYFKDAIRAIRLLFIFLFEQPGQFKYVEWPSFPTTLKTASLTLVLVAMLIVKKGMNRSNSVCRMIHADVKSSEHKP
ncbi:hypothetical protein V2J09_015562, partial [Rumex salicifolius]